MLNPDRVMSLLVKAEDSLSAFVNSLVGDEVYKLHPKFGILMEQYRLIRECDGDSRNPRFPHIPGHGAVARGLFWDNPESDLEAKCLEDAVCLMEYIKAG
ncbi:hypothetical protein ACNPQU_007071, partial [Pseudomonas aeruginosa]